MMFWQEITVVVHISCDTDPRVVSSSDAALWHRFTPD
jgi:hypothetical protein